MPGSEEKETKEKEEKEKKELEEKEKKSIETPPSEKEEKEIEIDEEEIANKVVDKLNIKKEDNYTGDQVSKLLKEVGKNASVTSKNQLYSEISRLKGKLKEVSESKSTVSNEEKEKLENEKSELKTQIKVLEDAVVEVTNQFKDYKENDTKEKLADYRAEKIKQAGGKIVEEMVVGNSREEIDAAFDKAKEKYKEVEEGVRKNLKLPSLDEEKEKKEKEEKEPPKPIERLDVSNPQALTDYKRNRKTVLDDVYKRAGFPVRT